ncbi:hypothetical protein IPM19_03715 [bacterium]|nr:MAG: hypothetical protein IPM19_03715 [bacterium]
MKRLLFLVVAPIALHRSIMDKITTGFKNHCQSLSVITAEALEEIEPYLNGTINIDRDSTALICTDQVLEPRQYVYKDVLCAPIHAKANFESEVCEEHSTCWDWIIQFISRDLKLIKHRDPQPHVTKRRPGRVLIGDDPDKMGSAGINNAPGVTATPRTPNPQRLDTPQTVTAEERDARNNASNCA